MAGRFWIRYRSVRWRLCNDGTDPAEFAGMLLLGTQNEPPPVHLNPGKLPPTAKTAVKYELMIRADF